MQDAWRAGNAGVQAAERKLLQECEDPKNELFTHFATICAINEHPNSLQAPKTVHSLRLRQAQTRILTSKILFTGSFGARSPGELTCALLLRVLCASDADK